MLKAPLIFNFSGHGRRVSHPDIRFGQDQAAYERTDREQERLDSAQPRRLSARANESQAQSLKNRKIRVRVSSPESRSLVLHFSLARMNRYLQSAHHGGRSLGCYYEPLPAGEQ